MDMTLKTGLVAAAIAALSVAACAGQGEDGSSTPPAKPSNPVAAYTGEKAEVAETLVAYSDAVAAGDIETLCSELLPDPRSIYERRNNCRQDPDNDARTGDVPAITEIERIVLVPESRFSDRIPDEIRTYLVEWALKDLADSYALVGEGRDMTAFGLSRIEDDWRMMSRTDVRDVKPPAEEGKERTRFLGIHGVLGGLGIVRDTAYRKCAGGNIGELHVDGTVTDVPAEGARDAILRSELVGEPVREALDRGGKLALRAVDYESLTRTFELASKDEGVALIPVEGNGPTYYVNNFGGCLDDLSVNRLIGYP